MASPSVPGVAREVSRTELQIWLAHLACFVLPVATLAFLASAPHSGAATLLWVGVIAASIWLDHHSPKELRQPHAGLRKWPFDAVLYALFAAQFVILGLAVYRVSETGFFHVQTLVALILVGINSGYSGIVVAHELIHRREKHLRILGRILMGSVLYEHFYTEHIRGHHVRVGTADDPATARFGETYHAFFRRTVPGQFRSAWRLEAKRLGDEDMRWWDARMLRSRVVHGLIAEGSTAIGVGLLLGPGAFFFYVLQALMAIRLLEAVNYFEHWGLVRTGKRVTPVDSWDTNSRFTLYTLVGLSRHSDHHAYATRPYPQLRHWDESPKLPSGYFGMVFLVLAQNDRFQKLMTRELKRRGLGPFSAPAGA